MATREEAIRVLALLSDGVPIVQSCKELGITRSKLYVAIDREGLGDMHARAREEFAEAGDRDAAQPGAEEAADLVGEQGQAEQRRQVAGAEQLADQRRSRRYGGQPGEAEAGSEQVVG